jgi:uncharacterized protein
MTPEERAYVRYRLEKAKETLAEARLLVSTGHLATAVSRLYYACFYCVSALLLCEAKRVSKHTGVRALFDRDWVNTGKVAVPIGKFYRQMCRERQKADYADLAVFDPSEVKLWLQEAEGFVAQVSALAEERLRCGGQASGQ